MPARTHANKAENRQPLRKRQAPLSPGALIGGAGRVGPSPLGVPFFYQKIYHIPPILTSVIFLSFPTVMEDALSEWDKKRVGMLFPLSFCPV